MIGKYCFLLFFICNLLSKRIVFVLIRIYRRAIQFISNSSQTGVLFVTKNFNLFSEAPIQENTQPIGSFLELLGVSPPQSPHFAELHSVSGELPSLAPFLNNQSVPPASTSSRKSRNKKISCLVCDSLPPSQVHIATPEELDAMNARAKKYHKFLIKKNNPIVNLYKMFFNDLIDVVCNFLCLLYCLLNFFKMCLLAFLCIFVILLIVVIFVFLLSLIHI